MIEFLEGGLNISLIIITLFVCSYVFMLLEYWIKKHEK